MSTLRTGLLLAGLTALFLAAGFLLGGEAGMMIALIIALGTNVFAYWNSDKLVLRMYGAREVDTGSAPALYGIVRQLADRANLPMPRVYVIDTPQPNAFATGRNPQNAAVTATTGLLERLSHEEVAGVMTHELAHVKNRDTLIMTVTATIAGALGMLANFALFFGGSRNNPLGLVGTILVMILAPLAAMVVQMAISRTREYAAGDAARGAEVFHYRCAVCHAIAPEFHKEGPSLHNVFGRKAGTTPFFPRYKALKDVDFTWSEESMDRFLEDPRAFLDGRYTKMTLKLDDAQARADVIAFLKTLR